jgi:hypothetical protein
MLNWFEEFYSRVDRAFPGNGTRMDRDRGESHDSSPPTPPYVRVRIRRFDRLSTLRYRDSCKSQ